MKNYRDPFGREMNMEWARHSNFIFRDADLWIGKLSPNEIAVLFAYASAKSLEKRPLLEVYNSSKVAYDEKSREYCVGLPEVETFLIIDLTISWEEDYDRHSNYVSYFANDIEVDSFSLNTAEDNFELVKENFESEIEGLKWSEFKTLVEIIAYQAAEEASGKKVSNLEKAHVPVFSELPLYRKINEIYSSSAVIATRRARDLGLI